MINILHELILYTFSLHVQTKHACQTRIIDGSKWNPNATQRQASGTARLASQVWSNSAQYPFHFGEVRQRQHGHIVAVKQRQSNTKAPHSLALARYLALAVSTAFNAFRCYPQLQLVRPRQKSKSIFDSSAFVLRMHKVLIPASMRILARHLS